MHFSMFCHWNVARAPPPLRIAMSSGRESLQDVHNFVANTEHCKVSVRFASSFFMKYLFTRLDAQALSLGEINLGFTSGSAS